MKLTHAVKVAKTVEIGQPLTSEQKIAVHVLAELGRRLSDMRPAMRSLWKAVGGEEELNQMSLDEKKDEEPHGD